ncbi:hypothetical protein SADUNF_Sadunf09G0032100 [Salix dunnii]|uniref:Uncharacterized protein n=1 Tax=Salix dunnii TaxID=1413687 RepID=A0A835JQ82_9ROSI|nr:hypothetical protein SADUNF_Sadunf09G0032100 [Salix dunnii]
MLKKMSKPVLLDGSPRQNKPGLLGLQWLNFIFGSATGLMLSPILLLKGGSMNLEYMNGNPFPWRINLSKKFNLYFQVQSLLD